jgi:hypothetical protein
MKGQQPRWLFPCNNNHHQLSTTTTTTTNRECCSAVGGAMEAADDSVEQHVYMDQCFSLLQLPVDCIESIISFLDKPDRLQLMGTGRMMAKLVMAVFEMSEKRRMWMSVNHETCWQGFKQV